MKNLQKGRSMIEMLGVLAIVGVLSIGGLAGYTMAMNRWRANTITDYVTRCVVVSQTNGVDGKPTKDASCPDVLSEAVPGFITGATIADYDANTDDTRVLVTGVSTAVAEVLTEKMGTRVNGVQVGNGGCGTAGTFTNSNATFQTTAGEGESLANKVCFSFANK